MPPQLALLLCTVFVLYLLRLDRRQSPDVSHAVWLPTLWLMSASTKPLAVWFSYTSGDADGSPLDQRFIIAVMFAGLYLLARRRFDWVGAMKSQSWLMVFVGYMFLSLIWSDIPFACFKRLVRQLVALIMACVVLSEPDPRRAVESILRRITYILIPFSVLLIKYYPHLGVEYGRWSGERMWVGVTTQKNGLGILCIVAILFLTWTLIKRWRGRDLQADRHQIHAGLVVLLIALYLLLFPEGKSSATSIVALGVGIGTLFGLAQVRRLDVRMQQCVLIAGLVSLVGLGIAFPLTGGAFASGVSEALGRDSTFTGRADTWAELVPLAMRHPLLGCGFDSFWTPVTRELYRMSHAHSSYLELFNELGVVGLLLFISFIISFVRNAYGTLAVDVAWGTLCISFLVMALVHGFTESTINRFTSQLGGTLLFLLVSLSVGTFRPTSDMSDPGPFPPVGQGK